MTIRQALAEALEEADATFEEGASACASILFEVFIEMRIEYDVKVAAEMRRMAARLVLLADTPAADMERRCQELADSETH